MILAANHIIIVTTSITVFLLVTILLVSILLYAKKKLTPSGIVKVDINEGNTVLDINPGDTLLTTLGNSRIFLPSACGGGGTCAMCRCRVLDGGGSILPTEIDFFTRKEQNNNWRLACQVKVKEDMKLSIPQDIMGIKKWECEVVSNKNVATYIKEFVVKLPDGENLDFKSGGYIQIDVPKVDVDFKDIEVDDEYKAEWERV